MCCNLKTRDHLNIHKLICWFTLGTSPLMAIGCYAKSKVSIEGNEDKIKFRRS